MGLGKTAITLMALQSLIHDSFEISRVLVIAPLRVAKNTWPDEIRKWDGLDQLSYAVAVGTPAQRKAAIQAGADILNLFNIFCGSNPQHIHYTSW